VSDIADPKDFWDETAKRFGEKGDFRPVLTPSSKGLLNWYTDYLQTRALKSFLDRFLGKKILDIGCGIGRWSERITLRKASVVGLDFSKQMIRKAKERVKNNKLENVDLVLASTASLPFVPETFDAILSVTVLQHIIDLSTFRSALSDILKIVKDDGLIVLLEYASSSSRPFNPDFPTVAHNYEHIFQEEKKAILVDTLGVDLSLFLKPLNRIVHRYGQYRYHLKKTKPSIRYAVASSFFYLFVSIACIFSLPFDLTLRNLISRFSEHKLYVFKKRIN
jgi:ubiquinone/menaquinone biosynthesis C-methylase UbiE